MTGEGKTVFLVDVEYHIPVNRPQVSPLVVQIAFIDLKSGDEIQSSNVDYAGATPQQVWMALYGQPSQPNSDRFRAPTTLFTKQYGEQRTNGLQPSQIYAVLRNRGFKTVTRQFLGYGLGAFGMTAVVNILPRVDKVDPERHKLGDMALDILQPVEMTAMVSEMLGGGDCSLSAVYGRMFTGGIEGGFHTAIGDTRALYKILVRLYEALTHGVD